MRRNSEYSEWEGGGVPLAIFSVVAVFGVISWRRPLFDWLGHAGLWLAGLFLFVIAVGAVVATTSASWTAGKRVASIGGSTAASPLPPEVAAVAEADSIVAQLRDLARLYESGALTDSEFADAKGRILTSQ